jgi:hypothetical protein
MNAYFYSLVRLILLIRGDAVNFASLVFFPLPLFLVDEVAKTLVGKSATMWTMFIVLTMPWIFSFLYS